MDITRRRLLVLMPAAAVAWKYVLAGTPEASPNYRLTDHWWGSDDVPASHLALYARFLLPRRGWANPPADRTSHVVACHSAAAADPAGGRQRGRRSLALHHAFKAATGGAGAYPPGSPHIRPQQVCIGGRPCQGRVHHGGFQRHAGRYLDWDRLGGT